MSEFLDELARTVATPMPRSRVLRLLAVSVVGAAVPGALRTRLAFAGPKGGVTTSTCSPRCHAPTPFPCACDVNRAKDICFIQCGVAGSSCCCIKEGGKNVGALACPPGTRCPKQGERGCPCAAELCGGRCCDPTKQDCVGNRATAQCLPKCKQNEVRCDVACCATNEECDRIRVGARSVGQCVPKCPQGRARCGSGRCCPPRWYCHNRNTGVCKKCPPGTEECGTKCCSKSQRCCGHDLCCRHGRDCCTVDGKRKCCPANTKCAPQILSGNIGVTKGSPLVCCPKDRYVAKPSICCPPGKIALNSAGLRVGPGLEPFCCANDQVCRSGSSVTCCQKSRVLGSETCCSGKCVDLQSDPNNCGNCGNVCTSGVCSKGICAFS